MSYRSTVVGLTPVAYWRLGEAAGIGATVAVDEMALRNGTYAGPTLGVTGLVTGTNTAVTFDGINDIITTPALPAMAAWSVGYWWKPTASSTGLASVVEFQSFDMILAQMPGDFAGFWDGVGVVTTTIPATVGQAAFWVWTFGTATLRIYKNGILVYSAARGRAVSADTLRIGGTSDGSFFVTGTLDEVAVWDRAVTAVEVASLYTAGITVGAWPTVEELAQVLNVDNLSDWETTFDRVLASAIYKVKSDIGAWDEEVDTPDDNLAQAALRMAELISLRPEVAAGTVQDPTYRRLLTGHRRRFAVA